MIKKLVSHLGEYKRAAVLTPLFAALEAVMDVLLPTIMAFIIDQGIEKGDICLLYTSPRTARPRALRPCTTRSLPSPC